MANLCLENLDNKTAGAYPDSVEESDTIEWKKKKIARIRVNVKMYII